MVGVWPFPQAVLFSQSALEPRRMRQESFPHSCPLPCLIIFPETTGHHHTQIIIAVIVVVNQISISLPLLRIGLRVAKSR